MRFSSIRKFNDFMGNTARFDIPSRSKWSQRVITNCLYYQSNYFLLGIIMLILLSIINPTSVLIGFIVIFLSIALVLFLDSYWVTKIRQPIYLIPICIFMSLLIIKLFGQLLLFGCTILIPTLGMFVFFCYRSTQIVIFLHAACRQQNIRNRLSKMTESSGITDHKSPMGLVFNAMGIQTRMFDTSN